MKSFKGTMLWIDLTNQSFEIKDIPLEWAEQYLGGEGFVARLLYDHLKPQTDPLGAENLLIFATGPLTGTTAPTSGRLVIGFKSPATGCIGAANVGGHLSPVIKKAGYDAVVVTGKAPELTYVFVEDDRVSFHKAAALQGKTTEETEALIRQELGNDKVRMAEIGLGGENQVLFASIMVDAHRAAGRGGGGAVMGSKNLKALVFHGTGSIEVADKENMDKFSKQAREELKQEDFANGLLKPFGTPSFMDSINGLGLLPTRNWQFTTFDAMDKIGYEAYHKTLQVKSFACYGCPVGCGRHTEIQSGEFAGEKGGGPEYETTAAFGAKCGIDDLNAITMAGYICNRNGLDTISAGQIIATAMEWYEKGIIDKETTGGIALEFGNAPAMLQVLQQIVDREGFGDLLAQGSYRAAEKLGGDAMKYVMHVKKLELAACGVRASKGETLSHITSERGADHLRPFASVIDAFGYVEPELGITEKVDPLEDGNKAWFKPFKELSMATNLLGVCLFASITLAVKGSTWTALYNAASGRNLELKDLLQAAERVTNLERLFNAREGFNRSHDTLPERLKTEPAPDGPGKGQVVNEDVMLDEYYAQAGWDPKTGAPTPEKLKELGLSE